MDNVPTATSPTDFGNENTNTMASFVKDTLQYLRTLQPRSYAYNYTRMDRDAPKVNTPIRHLKPVTQPLPLLPSAPPDDPPAPKCQICSSEWAAQQAPNYWCPGTLPGCEHGFCTLCTVRILPQRTGCPICKEPIPEYKQDFFRDLQTDFAIDQALEQFLQNEGSLVFRGALEFYDIVRSEEAAQRVANFLKMSERTSPRQEDRALIDMTILGHELVAFANMLPAFHAACGKARSPSERKQWIDFVSALHSFLDRQRQEAAEINAKELLERLPENVKKGLREDVHLEHVPDVEILYEYVVHVCQELYLEWYKVGSKRTRNVLRRRSRSRVDS